MMSRTANPASYQIPDRLSVRTVVACAPGRDELAVRCLGAPGCPSPDCRKVLFTFPSPGPTSRATPQIVARECPVKKSVLVQVTVGARINQKISPRP